MRLASVVGGAVLAVLAASCSRAVGSSGPPAPGPATRPSTSTTTPLSPGCGRPPDPGSTSALTNTGDVTQSLLVGSTARTYRLAVPGGYQPAVAVPLLLAFHGFASNALEFSAYTGLPSAAAARGYLVATPDAVNHSWSVSAPNAQTADLDLVGALISSLEQRYCVDPARVYAAGFSLGSEFTTIAACAVPGRFAAVALASAEFLLKPCPRGVPVIAFHGTVDPLVPYTDGAIGLSLPGVKVRGVENNLSDWAALAGCSPGPAIASLASDLVRRTWSGCPPGIDVVLYTAVGHGHAWPSYATMHVLDFFDAHRLPARAGGG